MHVSVAGSFLDRIVRAFLCRSMVVGYPVGFFLLSLQIQPNDQINLVVKQQNKLLSLVSTVDRSRGERQMGNQRHRMLCKNERP